MVCCVRSSALFFFTTWRHQYNGTSTTSTGLANVFQRLPYTLAFIDYQLTLPLLLNSYESPNSCIMTLGGSVKMWACGQAKTEKAYSKSRHTRKHSDGWSVKQKTLRIFYFRPVICITPWPHWRTIFSDYRLTRLSCSHPGHCLWKLALKIGSENWLWAYNNWRDKTRRTTNRQPKTTSKRWRGGV